MKVSAASSHDSLRLQPTQSRGCWELGAAPCRPSVTGFATLQPLPKQTGDLQAARFPSECRSSTKEEQLELQRLPLLLLITNWATG